MDVAFRHVRQLVIEDVADIGNVDAARSDVGRDQYPAAAVTELGEHFFPLRLALVAMDGGCRDARRLELTDDLIRPVLGAGEDDGTRHVWIAQQFYQRAGLGFPADESDMLLDPVGGGRDRRDRDRNWIAQETLGERTDRRRHGGRKHQALAVLRQDPDDLFDCRQKAEIEHLVGFVQDQDFDLVELDAALLQEIDQAAGRCNQNIDAACQSLLLLAHRRAAKNGRRGDRGELAVGADAFLDLACEFAGWREDQNAHAHRLAVPLVAVQPVEDRQRERGGLAGAGLGGSDHVALG